MCHSFVPIYLPFTNSLSQASPSGELLIDTDVTACIPVNLAAFIVNCEGKDIGINYSDAATVYINQCETRIKIISTLYLPQLPKLAGTDTAPDFTRGPVISVSYFNLVPDSL